MLILKVGGGSQINFEEIILDLHSIDEEVIVVLGANSTRSKLAELQNLNLETVTSVSGVSSVLTTPSVVDIIMQSYAGLQSQLFVEKCQQNGINAISLSGLDGGLIKGKKNKGIKVVINGKKKVIRDLSGKPDTLNVDLLTTLIDKKFVPVITIPIMGENGEALNTENDDIVSLLQRELSAERVIHLIEAPGILQDPENEESMLTNISLIELEVLISTSAGRFKRKLLSLQTLIKQNCEQIYIGDGRVKNPIQKCLNGEFTKIVNTNIEKTKDSVEWIELEEKYALGVFPKRRVVIERGKGAKVWDTDGNEYIDCVGGWGVSILGHSNPKIADVISTQSRKIITVPSSFYNRTRAELMKKLVEISPMGLDHVFLTNSGTESVEAALKFSMISTGRDKFISAVKGFHGRSLGSLSVTHKMKYREPFMSYLNSDKVTFVPFNREDKILPLITNEIAAVILEVIQGEGGVNIGDASYFQAVEAKCHETGTLLIIDEVQTGFCRTGSMFATDLVNITPDILCLAKAIAGGVPMGAVLTNDKVKVSVGSHGTTFGGNPLACAVALESINILISENIAEQAKTKGNTFYQLLSSSITGSNLKIVKNIRNMGLMIGIDLRRPVKSIIDALDARGVLTMPAGTTTLRLLPPAVITEDEIHQVVEEIISVLRMTDKNSL